MLRVVDLNGHDSLSVQMRQKAFSEMGIPYVSLRLNLGLCIGNLLEKSPSRIENFYEKLSKSIRGENNIREVHFENSKVAFILERLMPGDKPLERLNKLKEELAIFENQEKIDLYLYLPETIRIVSDKETAESIVEENDQGKAA